MNWRQMLWAFVPLVIFAGLAGLLGSGLGRDTTEMPSALIGKPVPEFALPSLLESEQTLTDEIFQGRRTLLNVWATWCPTCYAEHPFLLKLAALGIHVVGINYKDDQTKAIQYLTDLGNPYSVTIVDATGRLGLDLGVYGAPETFIISPEGDILLRHAGEINEQNWAEKFLPVWRDAGVDHE